GFALCLKPDSVFVVVTADRSIGAFQNKTALGLWLNGPGITKGAPASFEFRQATGVAGNGDAVLIDLQPVGQVSHSSNFSRFTALVKPGAEGGPVTQIIQQ